MARHVSVNTRAIHYNPAMMNGARGRWIACAILWVVGALVYANSLQGPFIFDDHVSIVDSTHIRSLWPLSQSFSAGEGSGASGRPLVAFSLALNYAWGELEVWGYHAFNVAVHLLTALALFGFSRLALLRTSLREHAQGLAFAVALLWVVHPLNTDALNHVITRHEAMFAGCFLATFYAAERFFTAPSSRTWALLGVLACAGAMASKEIAVSLPLLVLAYDRTVVAGEFRRALAERKGFYAGLAATWIVLLISVSIGERGSSVGFGTRLSALDYLRTQAQGIPHYLRLVFFPRGLAIDYSGWAPVREWGPAILPGLLVIALFLASCVGFARKRLAGLVGLMFFAVLAPSSSFIPLSGEWLAEHRMYLPSTFVIAPVVCWVFIGCRRLAPARAAQVAAGLLVLAAVPLAWGTVQRNASYATERGIWEDVLDKYPENARAHDHLAVLMLHDGELAGALAHGQEALRIDPDLDTVDTNLGTILMQMGQPAQAVEHFRRAEVLRPDDARLHGNFGVVLAQVGNVPQAIEHLQRAIQLSPTYITPHRNLALLLVDAGRSREALPHLRQVLSSQADAQTLEVTARLLATDPDASVRNGPEAVRMAEALVASGPPQPRWYDVLAAAFAESGRFEEARKAATRALEGARQLGQRDLVVEIESKLELYRRDQPYRAPRKSN